MNTFHLANVAADLHPRYNIAPTQEVPVVRLDSDSGDRKLSLVRWGLVPSWAKDPSIGNRMINARSETVAEKPSFRSAFRRRRCLVVADGYYEWKKTEDGKQPYHIRMQDERPFAMAGLWETWHGPPADGDAPQPASAGFESCTVITTQSNEVTAPIHDRMPVILHEQDWPRWLDVETDWPKNQLLKLLEPWNGDDLTMQIVSKHVNNPRHEGAECLQLVGQE